jgi:hypothetical protein
MLAIEAKIPSSDSGPVALVSPGPPPKRFEPKLPLGNGVVDEDKSAMSWLTVWGQVSGYGWTIHFRGYL